MTESERSPLAQLVLFMVCLAIAASILASAHYLVIDLPAQKNLPAPENAAVSTKNCELCTKNCIVDPDYYTCLDQCLNIVCSGKIQ